ncbi:5S rRNA E-loop-binding protein [Clostridium thermosuccinogenes]|jgi:large subunit ribosomal protein L25|uniref:Large ribosomal subunit protein bL25 n=1 Tax=Clostridium thermosuccinogenes TaxID=84032 RepID=A0A2K2F0G6_9CLOT|nr:50S ribosomal protein L25 [Pseudoclostridium thermosuccinogenes]AUS97064.1 5S rRNA E-loop-binding protein [Pseudoclostridium thermosuccinogenes]PNT92269.1 5S rRNA E-loop-binding protein [Pseudoclostridium thermosuccinogenes]PNT96675.1 5S rRNA E-loop-binding protein [Pseudoclostridium thermosuccinogenes]PNT98468.1 5S rRNA E-loop-binding protein [Pseudoclostridium thermosuccinogenes]
MITLLKAMERKECAKKVRKQGYVPCSIYGPGVEHNLEIQIEEKEVNKFLKSHSIGSKTKVKINDSELPCVIKSIDRDSINKRPIHIEFYASSEDKLVKVKVPLKFKGKELLLKNNLVLNINRNEVEIQGILKDLPEFIEVDVSSMEDGSTIAMGDIALPEGIRLLSRKDEIVVQAAVAAHESEDEIA